MEHDRDKDLNRTKRKDWIKTAVLIAVAILASIILIDYVIGDPGAMR